jgi:hypothetical protein
MKLLRRLFVPAALDEDIEHVTVLIAGKPQIMPFTIDRKKHPIQMPFVTRSRTPATQLIGICLPKLPAPLPDRFVRHNYPRVNNSASTSR